MQFWIWMFRAILPLAAGLGLLVAASPASAVTCQHVLSPGDSVGAAINSTSPDQATCLSPGTYSENVTINTSGTPDARIVLRALDPGPGLGPVTDYGATLAGCFRLNGSYVTVRFVNLRRGACAANPTFGVDGDHDTIADADATNDHYGATCWNVGLVNRPRATLYARDSIHDCGPSTYDNQRHCLNNRNSDRTVIFRSHLWGCDAGRAIQNYPAADNARISYNLIEQSHTGLSISSGNEASLGGCVQSDGVVTSYNVFRANVLDVDEFDGCGVGQGNVVRYNCLTTITVPNYAVLGNVALDDPLCAAKGPNPTPIEAPPERRVRSINEPAFTVPDTFTSSQALRDALRGYGVPYLRLPSRASFSEAQYRELLGAVRDAGARPHVIVPGNCVPNVAAADAYLTLVEEIFPTGSYPVEYGNENDAQCGLSASAYVAGWNRDVPQLEGDHPRALFIGPVLSHYDGPYISTFLAGADPEPDGVSWHDYGCDSLDSNQHCMDTITTTWPAHVSDYESRAQAEGYRPPVWITEWNLDPFADPRYFEPFIADWTRAALAEWTELARAGRIKVAELYALTDSFPLWANGALTLQGSAFVEGF
jgi:hypothetical protein